jgi:acyl-coenzyme A synthetase/AMP-(fatty) acid ligase/acyl carrier protein
MIEQRNAVALAENMGSRFSMEPGMVFGSATNYSFDMSVLELLGTFMYGMQLYLIADTDPMNILKLIASNKIDAIQMTPSRVRQLLDLEPACTKALQHLKLLLVGGEALSPASYAYLKGLTATKVLHVYGPTETTVWSSSAELQSSTSLHIGKPLTNENILILDEQLNLAPIGVIGEICIGGEGVARGYLNKEELTAEKFVPHPYQPGKRIYRTGDTGRWLADGNIEFIGRKDDQVKIRGYRVELGEIENVLQQHPDVDAVTVITRSNADQGKDLVAYVVSKARLNAADMQQYVGLHLPAYMVPAYFVQLDVLPLNKNGKINRKALPDPEDAGMRTGITYVAPRNEIEEKLVLMWQEILGREHIGVKDSFFHLGGHSLKATGLIGRIKKEFNIEVDLRSLFAEPTIEVLADRISNDTWLQASVVEGDNDYFEEVKI